MKIDIYAHILLPKLKDFVFKSEAFARMGNLGKSPDSYKTLYDLDARFRVMDKHPDVVQVLTLAGVSVDDLGSPKEAIDIARRANDEMAELVFKYPDRFAAGTAVLPMSDMDLALTELDRAINDLKLKGVLVRIPINGKAVDQPEFMPLYERMCHYNLPIWFHPQSQREVPDYAGENESKYFIWHIWGLPYETTRSMTRLVFSGVMQKFPDLKIITHHAGAMVPFFAQRIVNGYNSSEVRNRTDFTRGLTRPWIDYFRMFYTDTAIQGNTPALMCAYDFYGAEHLLFGTDSPFDAQLGEYGTRQIIKGVVDMDIPVSEKQKIFEDSAKKLLRLVI